MAGIKTKKAIHEALINDAAYILSIENNDIVNMQMVLRAYGYDHDYDTAAEQIFFAQFKK